MSEPTPAGPHFDPCRCQPTRTCLDLYRDDREQETRWLVQWETDAAAIRRPPTGEQVKDPRAFQALMSRHTLHPDLLSRAQARLRGDLVPDPSRVQPGPQSVPAALF